MSDFNCYARTGSGVLMPSEIVSLDEGCVTVRGPGGKEYTFPADRILSLEDGAEKLHTDRAETVAHTYKFETISDRPRAVRCSHPTAKKRTYILVEGAGGWLCSCAAFAKLGWQPDCKHVRALLLLEGDLEKQAAETLQRHSTPPAAPAATRPRSTAPIIPAEKW